MKTRHIYTLVLYFFLGSLFPVFIQGQDRVLITEVMYDTPLNEAESIQECDTCPVIKTGLPTHNGEFIEFYNPIANDVDLSGWKILIGLGTFIFPEGTIITSQAFLIVAHCSDFTPDFELYELFPNMKPTERDKILYQNAIFFGNNVNRIVLLNKINGLVDEVSYIGSGKRGPWAYAWKHQAKNGQPETVNPDILRSVQRIKVTIPRVYETSDYFAVSTCTPFAFANRSEELEIVQNPYQNSANEKYQAFYTMDPSVDVGAIPGQIDISPTGAATYQVPINLPPGINGIQPQLSVVYNSQAGNGLLGWGFNLAGLSAIIRTPKTLYSDNFSQGVTNTSGDRYALDGNLLIAVSERNNTDSVEYHTEIESFNRILSRGSYGGNGPEQFEVIAKDGSIFRYGSQSGRLLFDGEKQSVLSWNIDRVESPDGIAIDYEYENTELFSCIKRITYGDGCSIEFEYNTREDSIPLCFDGKTATMGKILQRIQVMVSGSLYRSYSFTYSKDAFSRLVRIDENNGSRKLNPLVFDWGKYPVNAGMNIESVDIPYTDKSFDLQTYTSVDINGDGLDDIIGIYSEDYSVMKVVRYLARKDENGAISFHKSQITRLSSYEPDNLLTSSNGLYTGDVDGDGIKEIILPFFTKAKDEPENYTTRLTVLILKGDCMSCVTHVQYDMILSQEAPLISVADINNDGMDEIIVMEKGKTSSGKSGIVFLWASPKADYGTSGTYDVYHEQINVQYEGTPGKIFTSDFNGNGMVDIMVLTNNKYHIYWNRGGSPRLSWIGSTPGIYSDSCRTTMNGDFPIMGNIELGDFDGNGLPDILYIKNTWDNTVNLFLNKGNGTFNSKKINLTGQGNIDYLSIPNKRFRVYDMNQDGKSDIIIDISHREQFFSLGVTYGYRHFQWFRSTGSSMEFVKETSYKTEYVPFTINGSRQRVEVNPIQIILGDFRGGGIPEIISYGQDCYHGNTDRAWRLYKSGFTDKSGKLTRITDSFKNKTELSYAPLSDKNTYEYRNNITVKSPVRKLIAPLYVVNRLTTTDAVGQGKSLFYTYRSAHVHAQGKGFLGFKEITVTDDLLKMRTSTFFEYDSRLYYSYMLEKKTEYMGKYSSKSISQTIYTNKIHEYGGKRFFPYVEQIYLDDYLSGVRNISKYEYDLLNGNLLKETTTARCSEDEQNSNVSGGEVITTRQYSYGRFGGNGLLNKPVETTTITRYLKNKATQEYEPPFTTWQQFKYDAKGHLIQEIARALTPDSVTTSYLHLNALGQPQTIRITAQGESPKESRITYDPAGRVRTTTNSLNEVQEKFYDTMGRLVGEKNHLGHLTIYHRDTWGNITDTECPDEREQTVSRSWVRTLGGDIPNNAMFYTTERSTGQQPVTTYFDSQGRAVRTVSLDAWSRKIYTDTHYNDKGQVEKASQPSFKGTFPLYTVFQYDEYGRKTQETFAEETTTRYLYDQENKRKSIILTASGKQTEQTVNAVGDVVDVLDSGGNRTTYQYHSSGQPRKVTSAGSFYTVEYDAYGQQTSLSDPDAGTQTYRYDRFGNIVYSRDARGVISESFYDAHGRLSQSKTGNQIFNYTYNRYGIDSISSGDAYETYIYDTLGRILSETRSYSGSTYKTVYSYDWMGRITQRTYPSGFKLSYEYTNGYLTGITDREENLLWKLQDTDALGHALQYQGGNGKITRHAYDRLGNLQSQQTVGIQHFEYNFDPQTGNLQYRKDLVMDEAEYFTYDNLNRLTGWSMRAAGYPQFETTYQGNGNISYKTNVGVYNYQDSNKPHALRKITNPEGILPSLKQSIRYNAFNRVESISEGTDSLSFVYGNDQQRAKTILYRNKLLLREKHFAPDYEVSITRGHRKEIHYIQAPTGLVAVMIRENNSDSLYYICTDHLGSITAVTDAGGRVVERHSYDAWGRYRNAGDWNDYSLTYTGLLDRGYTGHEHLREFGLINMNARLYDPVLGRFLSPDPYVQAPLFSQNFNRYSYCYNNPLVFIDPEGENPLIFFVIGGALIGSYVGASIKGGSWNPAKWEGNWWQGAIWGGLAGAAIGAGIGSIWTAGGSISFSLQAYGLKPITVLSFSKATADTGGLVTMTVGGGLGTGSLFTYTFGKRKSKELDKNLDPIDKYAYNGYGNSNYAQMFAEENFGDLMDGITIHADGSHPIPKDPNNSYELDKDGFMLYNGQECFGTRDGNDLYLYKSAFINTKELYLTIGHEYMHYAIDHKYPGKYTTNMEHHIITGQFEYFQGFKTWGMESYEKRDGSRKHLWKSGAYPNFNEFLKLRKEFPTTRFRYNKNN